MTERILKTSISTLEAFNEVRNERSLAHDNPILNYDESLLIYNHVTSAIRFIRTLESRAKAKDRDKIPSSENRQFRSFSRTLAKQNRRPLGFFA